MGTEIRITYFVKKFPSHNYVATLMTYIILPDQYPQIGAIYQELAVTQSALKVTYFLFINFSKFCQSCLITLLFPQYFN